jgi:predicted permease
MGLVKGVLRQLRAVVRKDAVERELDAEVGFHVEMATRKYIDSGLPAEQARRQALLRFHGVERHKESVRDYRWTRPVEDVAADIRFAVRSLARQPLLTVVAALTIAVGVGATAAVYSVTRALLLEPLPVAEPARLFTVSENRSGMLSSLNGELAIPYARFEAYAEATGEVFRGMAAYRYGTVALQQGGQSRATNGLITSPDFFTLLGVQPALGRSYTRDDGDVAVISHAVWQTHFGGAADVLGRVVHVDSRPYTVVGVAPPGFNGITRWIPVDVYLPYHASPAASVAGFGGWVVPIARLADGVTHAAATAAVDAAALRIPVVEENTTVHGARLHAVTGLPAMAMSGIRAFLALLFTTAGLVLVIACTNIAGILLARGVARRQEVAVRLAMGAGRGRLVRQFLTETMVLFLAGGLLGLILADLATTAISTQQLPFAEQVAVDITPDMSVLLFSFLLAALTGIVFGLLPALRATRSDLVPALKESAPTLESTRVRGVFVGAQLAMAVVLLIAAGLFTRSLQNALGADPGFRADGVIVGSLNLGPHGYDEERGRVFQQAVLERVRALPDVQAAALAQSPALAMSTSRGDVESLPFTGDAVVLNVTMNRADAAFAEALDVKVVAGRWFDERDRNDAAPMVVVNEVAAAQLWPAEPAVGARMRVGGREYEVAGVVSAGRYGGLAAESVPHIYLPLEQQYVPRVALHVRGRPGAVDLTEQLREVVSAVDGNVPLEAAAPLPDVMAMTVLPQRFASRIVSAFGAAGLLLAALGLYGVLSFYVAQRTREFGIRSALGAASGDVTRLVLGRALRLACVGCIIGVAAAAAVARLLSALLVGVEPVDPVTFVAVPAILVLTTVIAAAVPARRAMRFDPVKTLRA